MSRVVKVSQTPYIACEDWDFLWDPTDVLDVMCMWDRGKPIWEITEYVGRPQCEVGTLLIDLAESDRIKPRQAVYLDTRTSVLNRMCITLWITLWITRNLQMWR